MRTTFIVILATTLATGCSSFRKQSDQMGKWASDPVLPALSEPIDIVALISNDTSPNGAGNLTYQQKLDKAIFDFYATTLTTEELTLKRNIIQDRLKTSADQLCDEYKVSISKKQTRSNFWLGTTALTLGSIGALTTGATAARNLAGGAALATGIRSEYNQDYFMDQTMVVISKAIDQRQKEISGVITVNREKDAKKYTLTQAIDEVSRYHAACSLAGALTFTEKAVESYDVKASVQATIDAKKKFTELGQTTP